MRTAFVTGGSKGIGKAIAEKFMEDGYEVFAPTRSKLDLCSIDSVKSFIAENTSRTFDVIVNNAGINDINDIDQITDDEIERMMQVNLISPLMILRGFASGMISAGYGRIVNIGSVWGIVSKRGRTVYSATKHGIHGITKTLAVELAEHNILVNTVCPGFTLTELTRKNNSPDQIAEISLDIPARRMAQPSEIAEAVCWLAGENNTYITGQLIAVDGGYTSK